MGSASPLAAGATIPLVFIGAGLIAAIAATAWLALVPGLLLLPHLHPEVIALAHLWLLGALLTICFGAVYQLLPVLANTAFRGAVRAWAHLALHLAGTVVMVAAFHSGAMGGVAVGGGLVTAGVVLFAVNVAHVLRATSRIDAPLAAFGCAAAWLLVTVLAGGLLALNLRFGWWAMDVLALLRAHAHLGVVGFFITLLQGAMFRLVPMFMLSAAPNLGRVRLGLWFSQLGLALLAPALAFSWTPAQVLAAALLLGAFVVCGVELRRMLRTRRKRHLEPGLIGFLTGLLLLAVAAVVGTGLAIGSGDLRGAMAYAVVAIMGGLLGCIEGMLCKIVPFLVWMRVYGPLVGRRAIPQAAGLGLASAERGWLWFHVGGVILLAIGAAVGIAAMVVVGSVLFAAARVLVLLSLGRAALHLFRPETPVPAPLRRAPQIS